LPDDRPCHCVYEDEDKWNQDQREYQHEARQILFLPDGGDLFIEFLIVRNFKMHFIADIFTEHRPARIIAGIPASIPNRMTQPRSTLSIAATVIGPGVGGTKLCATARPASSGIP